MSAYKSDVADSVICYYIMKGTSYVLLSSWWFSFTYTQMIKLAPIKLIEFREINCFSNVFSKISIGIHYKPFILGNYIHTALHALGTNVQNLDSATYL